MSITDPANITPVPDAPVPPHPASPAPAAPSPPQNPSARHFSDDGSAPNSSDSAKVPWGCILGVPAGVILIVFGPLLLSIAEHLIFHTHRIEDFFRQVGLHDALSTIYKPIAMLFMTVTGISP